MREANVVVEQVRGCQKGIMIVEVDGLYYAGMRFDTLGVQRFHNSTPYKTIRGAENRARRIYAR